MFKLKHALLATVLTTITASTFSQQKSNAVDSWLTTADNATLFVHQKQPLNFTKTAKANPTIEVNEAEHYQTIDGFGFCLTGGSAQLLMQMTPASRTQLLKELFDTEGNHIGISYLRVSIGASDLNPFVFSYDDLPAGQTDSSLTKFDLGPDKKDVIPVLKEILKINPKLGILGSPWSAPTWMKTNGDTKGGSLKPDCQGVYARYLVKYIQSMKANGIHISAITVQNEPLHPGNNPSMYMPAPEQAEFVKNHLGPAFNAAKLDTKIIIYDHNADKPEYPISILNDAAAAKYIDGSAFHLYGGTIDALSTVHNAHPDKNLYFTEQWMGAPANFRDFRDHIRDLTIGATRNWCRTVLEWNLAADPQNNPHTDRGGCDRCLGAITLDKDNVLRNPAYYVAAHSAKFIRPGSMRIQSNLPADLPNVAFKTPDGKKVLVVINTGKETQNFNIKYKNQQVSTHLNSGSVATYVWK
ncbi:glucosylceramidase [Mucilaginibacter robiniae]|uniref:Glucosylceramidase n=1 Tax=Mucilaginibacter robiniae TaxID=2728022 RepID=A0A7L5E1R1_9SPHI|nr:glycoside hydrolase family 30 beta sandwich domain-containing protein [Mucilaginibacter robiniae]QJD96337.1 glucosylceramidase [Mucilaginibacter robiniae]